jgi:hypothetical protein
VHVYLEASIRLETLIASGENPQTAMATMTRAYSLTQGERELMWWAFRERRKGGKLIPVRPVEPQLKMPR